MVVSLAITGLIIGIGLIVLVIRSLFGPGAWKMYGDQFLSLLAIGVIGVAAAFGCLKYLIHHFTGH